MTLQRSAEVFEHGQAVFAEGADMGTDARMALSAFEGAKAARDPDPRLHEAEVAFGLVVSEGQFVLVEQVAYDDTAPWPTNAVGIVPAVTHLVWR